MKIHLYKLQKGLPEFDLAGQFTRILAHDLNGRNRKHGGCLIRLEQCEERGGLRLCDFIRIRSQHGPAKAGERTPAQGFDLEEGEGFGEETAFLWDSSNDWCVVQYNHFGVRPNAIATYLGEFVHATPVCLQLLPKIDERIQEKIKTKSILRKFSIAVAAKHLSDADYDLKGGLGDAIRDLSQSDADRINISISTGKHGLSFKLQDAAEWLDRLTSKPGCSAILSASATASENENTASEVLDLLNHRITAEEDLTPGLDKRYPVKDRWDALHRAHSQWKPLMAT